MTRTIATHNGKFHADDVFAVAALLLLHPDAEVVRTRDAQKIAAADIVVDVGGVYDADKNRFDHHQIGGAGRRHDGPRYAEGSGEARANSGLAKAGRRHAGANSGLAKAGARDEGIPYAAFGLVWKKFGEAVAKSAAAAKRVDEVLVTPVDANDNGIDLSVPNRDDAAPYDVSDAVRAFIPTWQEEAAPDTAFTEAVSFAKRLIEREVKRAEAVIAGQKKVEEAYRASKDKRLVALREDYSWKDTLSKFPEPLFVVHPQNDTWRLYAVRDNPHQFKNRKDLPESWAGLRDQELANVTGVSDATFCHRNRFMAVAKTREGALALARLALAN